MLTESQREFLVKRKITPNRLYMLPRWGFALYGDPEGRSKEFVATNPFTKSLDHEPVIAKEVLANELVRVNFYKGPNTPDFYVDLRELEKRDAVERFFLKLFCAPFFIIKNLITKTQV